MKKIFGFLLFVGLLTASCTRCLECKLGNNILNSCKGGTDAKKQLEEEKKVNEALGMVCEYKK